MSMKMEGQRFHKELVNQSIKIETDVRNVGELVVTEVFQRVVKRTPHDTGYAKSNWFISPQGHENYDERSTPTRKEFGRKSKAEAGAISLERLVVFDMAMFPDVSIYNNTPYIQLLEDGHSQKQAPMGMVAITIAEFESIVRSKIAGTVLS